jgi:NAD-dependent deacetylase
MEVHGSIEYSRCMQCGARVPLERVIDLLRSGEGAPECVACVAPLKPDVVLFGELLPAGAIDQAQSLAAEADLMICIGSSLTVHPVASLPDITRRAGGRLALITAGETPYDSVADVRLGGDVVGELDSLLALMEADRDASPQS